MGTFRRTPENTYDPVSGKYYRLNEDEKIVHIQHRWELDENGNPSQPIITKIVKKNWIGGSDVVWSSDDDSRSLEFPPPPRVKAGWIKPDRGFIDDLQQEIDGWIGNVLCQSG